MSWRRKYHPTRPVRREAAHRRVQTAVQALAGTLGREYRHLDVVGRAAARNLAAPLGALGRLTGTAPQRTES